MVICLRHGATDWNAKSVAGKAGDAETAAAIGPDAAASGSQELLRGNDPNIDLNAAGVAKVTSSAREIAALAHVAEIRAALQFQRDKTTAQIVAQVTGAPIANHPELAPWDPGELTGKAVGAIAELIAFLIDVPFIAPPGGEAIGGWLAEWQQTFHQAYVDFGGDDSRAVVLIVHGMELRALPVVTGTGAMEKYEQQSVKPGEFVVVH